MFAGMVVKLIFAVVAYFLTIILLIIIPVFTLISKFKKTSNVMIAVSFILYVYVGYAISTLEETLFSSLEESLGFFASFFNMSDMIKINIGVGYWLTIFSIAGLFFTTLMFYIKSIFSKRKTFKEQQIYN